jgi:Uncharacterized ACR, COG1678
VISHALVFIPEIVLRLTRWRVCGVRAGEAGELAKELEAGYWYVTDPDPALVFSDQAGGPMWEELLKRAGKLAAPGMSSDLAEKIGDQPRRFGGAGDQEKVPVIH